jgi:iron complex outermembrane receptor protein
MSIKHAESLNPPGRKQMMAVAVSTVMASGAMHAAGQNAMLEEVIVTATKRSENMQEIPQSIQAFTSDDIQRRGFSGIDDYSKQIPGIAFSRREPGGTSIIFRGVASSGIQYGTNPSASVYLDEQPITAAGLNPNPRLIDIERVEALSGPQGTLFGDASQSGTLRIITAKPDTSGFSAWIDASAHTVEEGSEGYELSGMVNIPVSDNVAIRLTGFTNEDAGYIDNVFGTSQGGTFDNAGVADDDVNTSKTKGGRASLRWEPNDNWTVDLVGIYQKLDTDGFGDTSTDQDDLEQLRFNPEGLDEEWYQVGMTIDGDLGWADATLAVSYFHRDFSYEADNADYLFAFSQLSSYYPYYAFYDFGDPNAIATEDTENKRWSVEARLATPSDSTSKWAGLIGVFYAHSESSADFRSTMPGLTDTPGGKYIQYLAYYYTGVLPGPSDNYWFGVYESELDQTAVFGEITYDITENLSITAGGRWYKIEDDSFIWQGQLMQGTQPELTDFTLTYEQDDGDDDGFVPKVNVTYNIDDDKLVYATYSEGFRRGGVNVLRAKSIIPREYDSDILNNYEIGAKTVWAGGALRVNVSAYHMVWDDIQVQANDPQPAVFGLGIVNAPEAEINGIETDFAWAVTTGLTIDGTYSYIEAEVSKDALVFEEECQGGTLCDPIPLENGTRLPIAPKWKASLGAEYVFQTDILGGSPYVRLDWSHIDESVNALSGLESTSFSDQAKTQDAYDTIDLKVGLDTGSWSAVFYVDNVDDERGEIFFNNRWGKERLSITRPRTYGVSFRKNF